MKIYRNIQRIMLAAAMVVSSVGFTACDNDDDELNTDQYASGAVRLNVFGPSPVARGGELRFIGSQMDKVVSVEIPGCPPITDIKVVSSEEIRVIVPQSAEPGKVTLNYADGKIVTKTLLTYTEPISVEEFAPASVLPGDEVTISGEYLNLIHEVIFSEGISVAESDFTSHTRNEIKVIVPEEAQSGLITLSDANEQMPNLIYTEAELIVVLPSVEAPLDLSAAQPGDEVTVAGKNLDLVKQVLMPDGAEVDFAYAECKITFTLPDNVSDGTIVAVPASGVKVAIANIGVVVPAELEAMPATDLRAGVRLLVKGVNMHMVSTVTFPNVADAVKPIEVKPTYISVIWPSMATSGEVTLNLKSGKTVTVTVTTAKPEVTGFNPNPVAAAADFTIIGKNLDLVKKVTFAGDLAVEVSNANPSKLSVTAPATASSGPLTLTMGNGETVTTAPLTIDAPQCAFITEVVSEELKGGDIMIAKIANGDKLSAVNVNGTNVQYIVSGDKLYISLPQAAGNGSVITLISTNGEISYTFDIIPATHVEDVIWSGAWEVGSWSGNSDLAWGGYDWSSVPAGAQLTLYMTPVVEAGQWWCVSLRHGMNWANLPGDVGSQIDMPADGVATITLTREILDDLVANGGLIITGYGYILTRVTLSWEITTETVVPFNCAFPVDMGSYSINLEAGPGTALIDAGVAVGKKLHIYMTPYGEYNTANPNVHLQLFDGHWNFLTFPEIGGGNQFNEATWGDMTKVTINITEDLYQRFITYTDWGYCLIFQGRNIYIDKVTIE